MPSNPSDLDVFLRALHEDDLLSAPSLAQMPEQESVVNGIDYGLGVGIISAPDGSEPCPIRPQRELQLRRGRVYEPASGRTIVLVTRGGDWWEIVHRVSEWADLDD